MPKRKKPQPIGQAGRMADKFGKQKLEETMDDDQLEEYYEKQAESRKEEAKKAEADKQQADVEGAAESTLTAGLLDEESEPERYEATMKSGNNVIEISWNPEEKSYQIDFSNHDKGESEGDEKVNHVYGVVVDGDVEFAREVYNYAVDNINKFGNNTPDDTHELGLDVEDERDRLLREEGDTQEVDGLLESTEESAEAKEKRERIEREKNIEKGREIMEAKLNEVVDNLKGKGWIAEVKKPDDREYSVFASKKDDVSGIEKKTGFTVSVGYTRDKSFDDLLEKIAQVGDMASLQTIVSKEIVQYGDDGSSETLGYDLYNYWEEFDVDKVANYMDSLFF